MPAMFGFFAACHKRLGGSGKAEGFADGGMVRPSAS